MNPFQFLFRQISFNDIFTKEPNSSLACLHMTADDIYLAFQGWFGYLGYHDGRIALTMQTVSIYRTLEVLPKVYGGYLGRRNLHDGVFSKTGTTPTKCL
jgi:hypothetical protein